MAKTSQREFLDLRDATVCAPLELLAEAEAKYASIRTQLLPVMTQERESKGLGVLGLCKQCEAPMPLEAWKVTVVVADGAEGRTGTCVLAEIAISKHMGRRCPVE